MENDEKQYVWIVIETKPNLELPSDVKVFNSNNDAAERYFQRTIRDAQLLGNQTNLAMKSPTNAIARFYNESKELYKKVILIKQEVQ